MHEAAQRPQVLSRTPGRLRLHLPGLIGVASGHSVEAELGRRPSVSRARLNPLTGNLLVQFDPRRTSAEALTAAAAQMARAAGGAPRTPARPQPGRGTVRGQLVRAGAYGVVGHALADTAFYAIVFAEPFGLPLAGLGALHLGLDILIWTAALAPLVREAAPRNWPYRKRERTALRVRPC